MDFFAHQDQARRASKRLVWLFIAAIVAVVVSLDLILITVWHFAVPGMPFASVPLSAHLAVSGATLAIILGGAALRTWELRGGGRVVAEMLGGRPVTGDESPQHRRLVNVVEEMALASGTPMPGVYVLERESGINAFAAGHQAEDAVVAVTRGTLDHLPRAELQGVIAHEFSHILNGDMRLNMRLMGLVHGLMGLSQTGTWIVEMSVYTGSDRDRKGGHLAFMAAGMVLWAVGGLGACAGSLIRAAISRNREFLADASAVQFTRDPGAIGGALKRIGGLGRGALLSAPRSAEAGHLLFGAGRSPWISWLATHPPLEERIRRIDPRWDGAFPATAALPAAALSAQSAQVSELAGSVHPAQSAPTPPRAIKPERVAAAVGLIPPDAVTLAGAFLRVLPPALHDDVRTPVGARAVAIAALCDPRPAVMALQVDAAGRAGDSLLAKDLARVRPMVAELGPRARLPIMDLAAPALRQLTPSQKIVLLRIARQTIWGAGTPSVTSYCLLRHLELLLSDGRMPSPRLLAMAPFLPHAAVVLSHLAEASGDNPAAARTAFAAAAHSLGTDALEWPAERTVERLGSALDACRSAAFGLRRRLVTAAAWSVAADGQVTIAEAEVLRVVATTVGCPLPFFADAQG